MQTRTLFRRPGLLAMIALGYAVAGWLSLKLAVPPDIASPVFPPAGIALSALLIYGFGVWPAVFTGAFVVELMAEQILLDSGMDISPALQCMLAATVTLQALAGAWLAQKTIGFPNRLDSPRPIVRFIVIVAPLSALLAPTLALPLLHGSGQFPVSEWFFSWWSWWLGDTIGIIVAAPLMFVFFGRPTSDWHGRRVGVAVPFAVALVILGLAFRYVTAWESMRLEAQFERDTTHLASQLSKRLDAQLDMLLALKGLVGAKETLSRETFRNFVSPWLMRYPGTHNFTWNPMVRDAERAAFEGAAGSPEQPVFRILDRDADGHTFIAPPADEYFPIIYVEPFEQNQGTLGLNALSLPPTARAVHEARQTGLPVVSEAFSLMRETEKQNGVVIYLASEQAKYAPAGQAGSPAGMISAAFRMDDALVGVRSNAREIGIELCLVDHGTGGPPTRLSGPPACDSDEWIAGDLARAIALPFAGRPWELRLRIGDAYLKAQRSWVAWGTVATGLFSLGLLGIFLLLTTGNTRRIASLVESRTRELEATTASLYDKQAALAEAMRIARMGSWETRSGREGLRCSHELHSLLGSSRGTLDSLDDILAALHPEDRPLLETRLEQVMNAPGAATLECRTATAPPSILQFRIESEWRGGMLARLRGTVQDVTAAREADAHIHFLAHYDTLTGLPNRSAWIAHAQEALASAERHDDRMAVLFLDLDNFKTINDSLGHTIGDSLLATLSSRLSSCMRGEDRLARLGGDEFVVLLPRLDHAENAAAVARKILEVLGETIAIDEYELRPSMSIGIAIYPEDGDSIDVLLRHADTAMYGAKAAGRNNYQFFVPEMNRQAIERLQLENALRRAIGNGELALHYQPQIDTASGCVVGCEALLRWRHPERGMVPPAVFIPVAEDSGMIVPIGEWVLREACRQQAEWNRQGLGALTVAINISALQFQRSNFVAIVAAILAETGANPLAIELEITESALMDPGSALSERLEKLVDMGLTLALDDFGTGYSSLAYLKRLPLKQLKIDRSFIADLPGDAEDAAVATAALSLARALGMDVVAEGVETAEQRAFLTERECTRMQGYLFSRPLDAAAFTNWVRIMAQA
ncbi:EAL domain-containing protein [Thauera sp. SDU_THAU2]|uniref:EAL domain-containing protein n=1 Tax=Thauera sp. SDU_THAU2 TaxID=3136633 RepID=UPI00311E3373